MGRLPDIIVIGAMKAGTTSLHSYLDKHPDIFMSVEKELNFFDEKSNWNKGLDWYKSNFNSEKKIVGEASPVYTKRHIDTGIAERIKETCPDVKLVYIIRDPIVRVLSHVAEYYYSGGIETDINQFILDEYKKGTLADTHIVQTSMYYYQIEEYLKYFDKNQIHILSLEDLKSKRIETLNKLFSFIGVRELEDESLFDFQKNVSTEKKMFSSFGNSLRKSFLKRIVKILFPKDLYSKFSKSKIIERVGKKDIEKMQISYEVREILTNIFKEDQIKLNQFTQNNER